MASKSYLTIQFQPFDSSFQIMLTLAPKAIGDIYFLLPINQCPELVLRRVKTLIRHLYQLDSNMSHPLVVSEIDTIRDNLLVIMYAINDTSQIEFQS